MPIFKKIINTLKPKTTFKEKREKLGFERNKESNRIEQTTRKEIKIKIRKKKDLIEKNIENRNEKIVAQIINKHKPQIKALIELCKNTKSRYRKKGEYNPKLNNYKIILDLESIFTKFKKPFSSLTETEVQKAIAELRKKYKEDQI